MFNRRKFLSGSAASMTMTTGTLFAGQADTQLNSTPDRIDPKFELNEKSIGQLQNEIQTGRYTIKTLVQKYWARIGEIDGDLGSVIELNPDAITIAEELDKERSAGKSRGPMHGIPVMVKDNFDTRDKMKTTAGSLALLNAPVPPEDSFVVKQLRKAGAVIIGKTNLSEWANIRSTKSTSGWRARGGQCNNPYVLDRNPCGSSSGSGVAVAANLCTVAVGTETDGSIVCPSACCSIVGIKPTVGLISRTGIIPISHSQDTAGPMARTVRDAAILLGVLAGFDEQDEATTDAKAHIRDDYTKFLDLSGLKGTKIGVARNYFGFHDDAELVLDAALGVMKKAGAELIDTESLAKADEAGDAETILLEYELKHDMAKYLSRRCKDSKIQTLKDLIDFNSDNKETELKFFGQEFFEAADKRGPLTENAYIEARAKCLRLTRDEGIDAVMEELGIDCFVAPTMSLPCLTDPVNGDLWTSFSTSPAAVSGYPSITVPAGYVHGLPIGMSFFGKRWDEPKLLKIAFAFEQATKFRKPPKFLPTISYK